MKTIFIYGQLGPYCQRQLVLHDNYKHNGEFLAFSTKNDMSRNDEKVQHLKSVT